MKNYSFAICENEPVQAEWLQFLLEEYAEVRRYSLHISAWESAEAFLFHYAENKQVDVILLDIQMHEMNGMEMARQLRQKNDKTSLVFITGMTEYIGEGYGVEAVDYLIKPVKKETLFQVLDRTLDRIPKIPTYILIEQNDEQLKIALENILTIEVDGRELMLKMDEQIIYLRQTLQEFMSKLNPDQFIQPYRNVVVNCERIKRVKKGELLMDDDRVVPISRRNQKKIVSAFVNYFRKE